MEDTLRVIIKMEKKQVIEVLILVLMEDTLRVNLLIYNQNGKSLSPCFNGRYSQRHALSSLSTLM